jgi:tetratricopeptide (TPR) repeat protein
VQLKAEGNKAFQADDMDAALDYYTRAIDVIPGEQEKELAVLFKNRAAVHLKREDFQLAVDDCSQSLELVSDGCDSLKANK